DRAPPARRIASKARSYACFGPVMSVAGARPFCLYDLISRRALKRLHANPSGFIGAKQTLGYAVGGRSSAARAAHREQGSLLRLFRASDVSGAMRDRLVCTT
ncbi:hypothetical protein, partial [Pseudomonas taiwanensis]|uniref:hypothetical protein n=1 Tax=Pseudomonas taiwanensis TaxID=470150 RepID=UPI001EE2F730